MAKESTEHILIPKHAKLSDKETKELFDKYKVTIKELPKIKKSDPAIADLDVKTGDVVRITRDSQTAGKTFFYRGVING